MTIEESERYWELYVVWCEVHDLRPDISGFSVWLNDTMNEEVEDENTY